MNQEEKAALKKELVDEFVLIPKNRWYYLIGGAVAVVVIVFGIGIKSVITYLGSQPAQEAHQRLLTIMGEAERYRNEMLAGLPRGAIIAWNGTGALPPDWVICDGQNDTPDLTDRFIMGVASTSRVGEKAGSATHAHDARLTGSRYEGNNVGSRGTGTTRHDDNRIVVAASNHLPPYATLIYIMKR